MTTSIFDSNGLFLATFTGLPQDLEANFPTPAHRHAPGVYGPEQWMTELSVVQDRPTLPVPVAQTVAAGADWTLTGIPAGTEIYTDGELVGTADGNDVGLTFPSAQVWTVEFVPPFPHQVASTEVTVT